MLSFSLFHLKSDGSNNGENEVQRVKVRGVMISSRGFVVP